ncbi:MAG: acetylglutamate kinase [Bacteroidetes bacterium SW_9_63_38]|nr:MAG: acetylglutamate kinase [Bacteroidetes bacterium SW_9_63_38]
MQTLYVVYLDRPHLGDELFLKSLAQYFAESKSGEPPCLLVHGSGEKVERTLESKGHFPERTDGVLEVEGEDQRRLVERAVRETNQEIVAALTDEVVSTVGIQGVDRNLLGVEADGSVTASNVGWLAALIKQRVVPVVSALVETDDGTVEEVWAADVVLALVRVLSASFDPAITVLSGADAPSRRDNGSAREETSIDEFSDEDGAEVAAVKRMHTADVPIFLTSAQELLGGEEPRGTRLVE